MLGIKSKLSIVFHPQTNEQTERVNQELEQYYLYTTPLLDSWQQFSPPEIYNHTHNSRSKHSARAKTKVVLLLLLSTLFHSGVILLHSRSLCSHSACPWHVIRYETLDPPCITQLFSNAKLCLRASMILPLWLSHLSCSLFVLTQLWVEAT